MARPASPAGRKPAQGAATRSTRLRAGKASRATEAFEKALAKQPRARYVLRLYVAGASQRSVQAILRAQKLCQSTVGGTFELQVIDVYQQPLLARDGQIVATPTLVRELPRPVRRFIGDLSNTKGLFVGLDLLTQGKARP